MRRRLGTVACLALLGSSCALTVEGDDGGAAGPAPTSPVTTSPVTTSQEPSPVTISPVTTSPVTTSQDPSPVTTSPVTTTPAELDLPAPLEGWETTTIQIGDRAMVVAVADTTEKRRQGLMFVGDLRDLDGMLFVFDEPRAYDFWMKNVPVPLDIAWFDESGTFVGGTVMTPCVEEPCGTYGPGVDYLYAVEAAEGYLGFVTPAMKLRTDLP